MAAALIALSALAVWTWAAPTAYAQEQPVVVEGQVTNATNGGGSVDGLTAVLHLESAAVHDHLETTTDADGRFRFDRVVFDPTLAYGVSVNYQGGLYGVDLDLSAGSPPPVTLTVYEASTSDEAVSVSSASVLFAQADQSTQAVAAIEVIRIVNDSDHAYVPGPQPMDLLRFGLPSGAQGLQVDTRLPGADFIQVDLGFALLATVPPGEHEMLYTYEFPYSESEFLFTRSFIYGVENFRVLVPDEVMKLSSDQLGSAVEVSIEGRSYQFLEVSDLPRGAQISLELGELPQSSLTDGLGRRVDGIRFEYAALVALGLLMVITIAYALKRRSGADETMGARPTT